MATPNVNGPVFLSACLATIFILGIGPVTGQCPDPVTPCNTPAHHTTIDLSTIPECGVGTVNIQGDIQGNQSDCRGTANSSWKCHEFTITRPVNSLTQQFTLNIGQGAGCNGELDASYAIINGVCTQLSAGGSQTTITFTFPIGVNSITLFLCLNSSAFVTICNLCAEPPPCSQPTDCNLSAITGEGCQDDVLTPFTDPADVFTNIGSCAGTTLILDHVDVGDTDFCDANGVDFVRTYTLYFMDTNGDTIAFRICAQNIQVTPILPSLVCQDITIEGCNTSAITGPAFSTATAISSETEFENATNQGNASGVCGISSVTYIDVAAGSCPIVVTRTWTVSDACNNSATCNQSIHINDTTSPSIMACAVTRNIEGCNTSVITGPAFSTITTASSEAAFENGTNQGNASDACGITAVTYIDVAAGTCPTVVTRKWTISDACGNSSTCNQTINVDDNTAPSIIACAVTRNIEGCNTSAITGPPYSIISAASSEAVFEDATNLGNVTDACGVTSVTYIDMAAGTCPIVVTRNWTVSDACGNSSTCNQTINVDDNTSPVCVTHDITISIDQQVGHTDVTPQQIDNGSSDLCGPVTLGLSPNSFTCMNVGVNIVTLTVTDVCNNTSTCTATVTVESCYNPCITIDACVYLEGDAANPNGSANYSIPMRTSLNILRTLPGQTYTDPFTGLPHFTPPGQPYCTPPWNYCGTEGVPYDSNIFPFNADAYYPTTVVDWVLVSLRDNAENIVPLCQAAALLHNDGHLEFVQPFDCCDLNLEESYYLVVEHRNHLIVMSHIPVPIVPGVIMSTLTYSFCVQQSFLIDPILIDVFSRQKEILPGVFAMLAGNGFQMTSIAAKNIDADDLTVWQNQNGDIGAYRTGDYNLNGDTNSNDRVVWERNNGKSTSVPR